MRGNGTIRFQVLCSTFQDFYYFHTRPPGTSATLCGSHLGEMPIAALGVKALNPVVQSGIDCAVVKKYALLRYAAPKPED